MPPPNFFISVRRNFNTKKFVIKKSVKNACFVIFISLGCRASLTSWGEGASLDLVGHFFSDGITIKMPFAVDVLLRPASHPIFPYWVG